MCMVFKDAMIKLFKEGPGTASTKSYTLQRSGELPGVGFLMVDNLIKGPQWLD